MTRRPPRSTLFPYTTALPIFTAMQNGAHVLVEKPLAVTLEDCDSMIDMSNRTGLKLGMVSQRRFYPSCKRIKEAIRSEEHTSELQSQSNLVCRLLLEKKKKK